MKRIPRPSAATSSIPRTDLACEATCNARCESREEHALGLTPVTVTRREEEDGTRSVTLSIGPLSERSEAELTSLAALLADELTAMASRMVGRPITPDVGVLVVGLGNADMTPDALGPGTTRRLTATRHLRDWDASLFASLGCCAVTALAPGVLGQTGLESAELTRSAAALVSPDLIVAVDALAARSCERLAATIQLSDGGIAPGAGIGNHRAAISRETMGVPVLALGVPTVVDSATLVLDALAEAGIVLDPDAEYAHSDKEIPTSQGALDDVSDRLLAVLETGRSFVVAPRDADRLVELACRVLAEALECAFGIERTAP